ncbi:MAG: Nickel transporter UreH [bacterium]|nr:Nickel transporter UreH [bacterium]
MLSVVTGAVAGLALGVRHAFEPDHLAAVSTIVAERPGARRGLFLGAAWGVGHTLALFVVATVLALCEVRLPPRIADAFELLVAAMLVTLGVRAIVVGVRAQRNAASPARRFGRRSLIVGVVHGLAGSGALTALVLANLSSTGARLGYVALFGLGSIVGMALLSSLAGWPLERLRRARRLRVVSTLAGAVAAALGVAWAVPIVARLY